MLAPYSRSKFVEKILTDQSGRQFKVLFLVTLVNGEVAARPISAQALSPEVLAICGDVCESSNYLPVFNTKKTPETPYISPYAPVISPYASGSILEAILTSQPTRAPSRI